MRIGVRFDSIAERIGSLLNLVPVPIGIAMVSMPAARSLQVAQRLGILRELAGGPATAAELAARLSLREQGTRRVLDVLVASGQVRLRAGERYSLEPRAAKWLDPSSSSYVGDFLADTSHYWQWWAELEALVREGRSIELHDRAPDDPYWRSTSRASISSRACRAARSPRRSRSRKAPVPCSTSPAHTGSSRWRCAQRHPELRATVVDLPGSAAIGREIVVGAGMADRVGHVDGDMFEVDLGGPHDGALAFNIIHHLSPAQITRLFGRIAAALRLGATFAGVAPQTAATFSRLMGSNRLASEFAEAQRDQR